MTFYERYSDLCQKQGKTPTGVGAELLIDRATINYWKNNHVPKTQALLKISNYFGVSVDYLLGNTTENIIDIEKYGVQPIEVKKFPLLGDIACGEPRFANEERESYISAGTAINADFCLKARGESMINARIMDGDIVFIRSQSQVENGEIAVVIINDEATLKRVFYYPEKSTLILKPENPKYEDFIFTGTELNDINILGKAVAFQSDIK